MLLGAHMSTMLMMMSTMMCRARRLLVVPSASVWLAARRSDFSVRLVPQQPMPPPTTPLIAQLPLQGARKVTHQHVRFALRFSLLLKPCFDIALRLFFSRTQAQHRSTVFHTGIAHASLPSTHRQKIYQGRSGADFSD